MHSEQRIKPLTFIWPPRSTATGQEHNSTFPQLHHTVPGHRTCCGPGRCPCGSLSWVWSHPLGYLKRHHSGAQCLGSGAAPACPTHPAHVATRIPEPRGGHPVTGTESKQAPAPPAAHTRQLQSHCSSSWWG